MACHLPATAFPRWLLITPCEVLNRAGRLASHDLTWLQMELATSPLVLFPVEEQDGKM